MANTTVYPYGTGGSLPSSVGIINDLYTGGADKALSAEMGKKLNEEINTITEVDLSDYSLVQAFINTDGEWVTNKSTWKGYFVPTKPGETFILVANEDNYSGYAVLANNSYSGGASASFAEGGSRVTATAGEKKVISIPSNGYYLWIGWLSTPNILPESLTRISSKFGEESGESEAINGNVFPDVVKSFGNSQRKLSYELDNDGYEVPKTLQVLNVIRKAKQLTSVSWTTKGSVPKGSSGSWASGTTVTGIPYSNVGEYDKYVGEDVSLHTFMTAVNNPYSLLYTENVSAANSASAWGKTYHGTGSVGPYYGLVCTVLSSRCAGFPMSYVTNEHDWLAKKVFKLVKIYDQSAQGLEIGDIYYKSNHCRLIVGLKRDSSGAVTHVKIAEGVTPTAKENSAVTAASFNSTLASENGIIYRPLELYRNIDYQPSPYIAVGDETPQTVTYNNDICCFAGDRACFREGDTIALNYNLQSVGTWTGIELYKNDTLLDTISIDTSAHVVDLTSRNLTYGKYKARMTDGTTQSDYTYFEILSATVTCDIIDSKAHMTFASSGKTVFARVCLENGQIRGQRTLTDDEIAAGEAVVDFVALNQEQNYPPIAGEPGVFLKVFFEGEYGRVSNIPIPVQF